MSGGVPLRRWQGFLSFHQLNAFFLIVVFSASGMVGVQDFAFVLLFFSYMFFLAKVAFPIISSNPEPPVFSDYKRLLNIYVTVAALTGLFLPVAYILHGVFEGDKEGIKAAAPHVFLLASQVLMEGVSVYGGFSLPIRVLVPVGYNAMRMFTIMEWVKNEVMKANVGEHGSSRRLFVGRGLAMANMVFWGFNLFGFLLPVYLPRAFKKYYGCGKDTKDS